MTFESPQGADSWDHHWAIAATMIEDKIQKKRDKEHSVPSIVVMDDSG